MNDAKEILSEHHRNLHRERRCLHGTLKTLSLNAKVSFELAERKATTQVVPAVVHRDRADYATALRAKAGRQAISPEKLASPMLAEFMASDRESLPRRGSARA